MRAGSLFSGYGGLSLAVEEAFGASTAWVADVDKAASRVLDRRFPGAPNLGDVTAVDWATVEPVDIIEGGSPCQDISTAGRGAGMTEGTRSNLWVAMREAIHAIKPTYVIWENVHGAHSAPAVGSLEPCAGCVGDGTGKPALRALGRVLGDLAELGFDAEWCSVRASDVAACHQRRRVFILAWHPDRLARQAGVAEARPPAPPDPCPGPLLPTPRVSDTNGPGVHGAGGLDLRTAVSLLPTPRATRGGSATETVTLLPTPTAMDHAGSGGNPHTTGTHGTTLTDATVRQPDRWGRYAAAIARHGQALGRPAPEPTIPGRRGGRQLSGEFDEWMMMLPAGWIWDLVRDGSITNADALRLCGNGVVPPQAIHALRLMLPHIPTH